MKLRKPYNTSLKRRDFLLSALASLSLPILSACGEGFKALSGNQSFSSNAAIGKIEDLGMKNSNVLFISVDDLNDWISPLAGYPGKIHTPNFDRLAKMGVTFNKAYCAVPSCVPSRAATLSGIAPTTSGFYGSPNNMDQFPPLANAESLPAYFKRMGYRTMGGGKVFHGAYSYGPTATNKWFTLGQETRGWDFYRPHDDEPRPPSGPNNGLNVVWDNFDWSHQFDPPEDSMPDRKLAVWASDILSNPASKFFLAVGLYRPHLPWFAPLKYFEKYPLNEIVIPPHLLQSDLEDVPQIGRILSASAVGSTVAPAVSDHARVLEKDPNGLTYWKRAIQAYLASISFADACLGTILDGLEKGPHAKNTTIVLWSDNGFQLGEKGGWRKFKLWEKSARVPMMIVTPNRTQAGQMCERPVSLLDIYPTLAEGVVGQIPNQLDGNTLSPLLMNPRANWTYGAVTTFSILADGSDVHRSIRSENYRYIWYADGSEELYDHRVDPFELKNLLHPINGRVAEFRRTANVLKGLLPKT